MLAQCTYELVSENPDVGGNSSGLDVSSSGLDVRSSGLEDDSTELHAIAAPVAGTGKASSAAVREVINQLCAGRYLTTESLGRLLNRNTRKLTERLSDSDGAERDSATSLRRGPQPSRAGIHIGRNPQFRR